MKRVPTLDRLRPPPEHLFTALLLRCPDFLVPVVYFG
jgi:hypothetical protein